MHNRRLDIYKLVMTVICAMMHFEAHFFPKDRLVFAGGYLVVDFSLCWMDFCCISHIRVVNIMIQ